MLQGDNFDRPRDFDSLRGSCTAPSNKHVCFTGSLYNYVCKVWGIHNCMLHHTQRLTADMSGLVWHCRPFTQNARESNPVHVPATPIGAAVCGLVNIIMTSLAVCIGMTTGGFVKGKC